MGLDNFEDNAVLQSKRENSLQSTSVTQAGWKVWTEKFIEKTHSLKNISIFDFFYSLVRFQNDRSNRKRTVQTQRYLVRQVCICYLRHRLGVLDTDLGSLAVYRRL